ncbi:MAG: hypothetical protein Q9N32_08875 [Gammaproteobacteria bacterium]|nr:hypothetical protein [Gammaproteobacteria bacterium]
MLENNVSEQYQQLERDFEALLAGQANPITLALSWKELDLSQVLHYFQQLLKKQLTQLLKTQQHIKITIISFAFFRCQMSDCITDTIKLISSPNNVNKTLLTEDFIVSVMTISQQTRSNR